MSFVFRQDSSNANFKKKRKNSSNYTKNSRKDKTGRYFGPNQAQYLEVAT